jgi:hypothetical protein
VTGNALAAGFNSSSEEPLIPAPRSEFGFGEFALIYRWEIGAPAGGSQNGFNSRSSGTRDRSIFLTMSFYAALRGIG